MTAPADYSAPPRVYLIRHGETTWSLSGQHTGRTDLPLVELGEEQARTLAPWLAPTHFTRVLTSPRQRAGRTCELAGLGAQAEIDPDLAEWDYGAYEGLRTVDIHKSRPSWNLFSDGCPDGESPRQISDRADRVVAQLQSITGNVVLFSHGQFGAVLGARWIGLPVSAAQHFPLYAASLSILGYAPRHLDVPVLELWNALPPARAAVFGLGG